MSTLKSVNIYGCEGSEIVNVPTVFAEPKIPIQPDSDKPFNAIPIDGGKAIKSTYAGYDFDVWYLADGQITSVQVDEEMGMISLELSGYTEGPITLSLSRAVIDASDNQFIIMTSPGDLDDYEIAESTDSNVIFVFNPPTDTERIEIYGSKVIPEFGSVVLIVLVVSLLSIVIATRRNFAITNWDIWKFPNWQKTNFFKTMVNLIK